MNLIGALKEESVLVLKPFGFNFKVLVGYNYDKSVEYNNASNKVRK